MKNPFSLLLALSTILFSCDSTSNGTENSTSFLLTGIIENPDGISIPASAKLYGFWVVSSGSPDYIYQFGSGTVNTISNTFSIRLSHPPASVLNANQLGVGYFMVFDAPLTEDTLDRDFPDSLLAEGAFYGAINDRAIVYINGSPSTANYGRAWVTAFPFTTGYNFAKGWYGDSTSLHDGFSPDSGTAVLTINKDPRSFTFPNWTSTKPSGAKPD